ncbi:hypothetical protein IC582_021095 [Cucumis melo]
MQVMMWIYEVRSNFSHLQPQLSSMSSHCLDTSSQLTVQENFHSDAEMNPPKNDARLQYWKWETRKQGSY